MPTLLIEYAWWLVGLLVALSLKVLLLALVVWAGLAIGRVRSATWAHRVWSFCLVAMLAMPLLAILAPTIPLPWSEALAWKTSNEPTEKILGTVNQAAPSPAQEATTEPVLSNTPPSLPEENQPVTSQQPTFTAPPSPAPIAPAVSAPTVQPSQSVSPTLQPWPSGIDLFVVGLASLYLAGWAIMVVRLAWAFLQCRRLIKRSSPAEIPGEVAHLAGNTSVLQSPDISVPLCQGIWQTIILLPTDWKTWDASLLRMVVSHEAEHVRRRDPLVACLAAVSTTLYWFHPIAWWLQRTLADLAEHACDDAVIGALGERNHYARILLDMARRVSEKGRRLQPICVGMARKLEIEERVERVIDTNRPLSKRIGLQASTLLLMLVAATSLITAGLTITSQVLAQDETTAKQDAQSIQGNVILPDGKPAAGAEVRLLTYDQAKSNYNHRTTQTDTEGKFQFKDIASGNHRVAAFLDDMASRTQRYKLQRVEPGDKIELKLSQAPTLKVQVLKQSDDTPIPDARVRLTWADLQRDHTTNAAGIALIRGLTAEEWTFEVQAKGYGEESQAIQLTGNEVVPITVKLKPGFAVYGTIRDDQGKPVPDVGISAFEAGIRAGQLEYTKTDAEGKYRFDYLPLTSVKFFITQDGYESISPVLQQAGPPMGEQQFDITLSRSPFGGSIAGEVLAPNGTPVADAKISNQGRSSTLVRETKTDAEGKYRLDNLYELFGQHPIVVQADGFAPQKLFVTPGPQEKPAIYNISLKPGRTISGTVLGPDNQPLPKVFITYNGPIGDQHEMGRSTETDAEGKFTLNSLTQIAPLTFQKANYSTISESNFPADNPEPLVVHMRPEGVIQGTVVDDKTGKPVTDFTVHITFSPERKPDDPNGTLSGTRAMLGERVVNAKGMFELRQLIDQMPLQVTIQADGYQKAVHTRVVVATDATAKPEEFRLKAIDRSMLKTFAGKVVDAAGKAVPGVQLRLIAAHDRREGSRNEFPFNWQMVTSGQLKSMADVSQFLITSTDTEGRFTFTDVLPSPDVEIAYWGGGVTFGRLSKCERLDQQQRTHLVIKTIATGSLSGQINRKRFQDVSRVMLSSSEAHYTAKLSPDGTSYQFEDVSSGNYTVHIYGPDREVMLGGRRSRSTDVIFSQSVRIRPGQHETVDLGMQPSPPKEVAMPKKPQPKPPAVEGEIPAGQIRLAGQVLTPEGQGIPQAKLWLPKAYREILVETVADDKGRFSMLVPRQAIAEDRTHSIGTLWSYAAGRQIGSISVAPQLKQDSAEPVGVILEEATNAEMFVESIDGKPIAGARVSPLNYKTGRGYDLVPQPLQELLGGVTDTKGRIKLPACSRKLLSSVIVTAEQYGQQQVFISYGDNVPAIETIELKPVGRVEGQLTAKDQVDFSGTEISVSPTHFGSRGSQGMGTCTADEKGTFVIPKLAAGEYQIHARLPDDDHRLQARIPGPLKVTAGQTAKVALAFEPTITARGKLQTQDEKKPVAGAWLIVTQGGFLNAQHAFTDENGIYTAQVLPGQRVSVQLISKPTEYTNWLENQTGRQPSDIPLDAKEFELPTIELIPTLPLAGTLVDAFDRPVEGVQVIVAQQGRVISMGKTDAEGRFTLHVLRGFQVEKYSVSSDDPFYRVTPTVTNESPLVLKLP